MRLEFLAKSLIGEEVARELINMLSVQYEIESKYLLGAMRDGASVKNVAMQVVNIEYPDALDIRCFSHTLDLIGKKYSTPVLSDFCMLWLSFFPHSPKTKMLWKEQTGRAMPKFSKTRWWNRWEVLLHIMLFFGDVEPFLTKNSDIGPSLRPKLFDMLPPFAYCNSMES